jgi:PhoH-like ATPase
VSKDINMRVKARALGLATDDYQNDKTLEDGDLLYSGALALPPDFWAKHGKTWKAGKAAAHTFYRITGPIVPSLLINQFVYFEAPGEPSLYARVTEIRAKTAVLKTLKDYGHLKNAVWGVTTRNREQNFAMNLLMDPEVDFVTLTGTAGTGKTLMALASRPDPGAGRPPLHRDHHDPRHGERGRGHRLPARHRRRKDGPLDGRAGRQPGSAGQDRHGSAGEWGRAATNELIRSRIKIKSMNFMRGRTFLNKYVIIDEAQNLTPKQMKTLITRAGPGTKIICMGNLAQIDTPYLTEGSSGLTYAVDRSRAGRTAATSRWRAASARAWRTSPAKCSDAVFQLIESLPAPPPLDRLSNLVIGLRKASLTVPVGPLRCLLMMTSATPGSLESLL